MILGKGRDNVPKKVVDDFNLALFAADLSGESGDGLFDDMMCAGYKVITHTTHYEIATIKDWFLEEKEKYPESEHILREYMTRHKLWKHVV